MPQGFRSMVAPEGGGRPAPVHLTALAMRSWGQLYDMNLSAARVLLQTQARAASALGLPDWSGLLDSVDERARHVFSASAEQFVNTAQRANEVAAELQREVGRVVETEAATVAQTFQQGLQQLGTQVNEGFEQLVKTAREQAEEAERVASAVGEEVRSTMEEGEEEAQGQSNGQASEEPEKSRRGRAARR